MNINLQPSIPVMKWNINENTIWNINENTTLNKKITNIMIIERNILPQANLVLPEGFYFYHNKIYN